MDCWGASTQRGPMYSPQGANQAIGEISTAKIEKSIRVRPFKKASNSPCKTGDRELVHVPEAIAIGHYILIRQTQNA